MTFRHLGAIIQPLFTGQDSDMDNQLISEYLAAFKAANPGVAQLPTFSYAAGWYTIHTTQGGSTKKRAAQIIAMRDTLLKRVAGTQLPS
jgi:hypothetical protein